jgi:pimeloyl-ACP methyl ester carboxylesterase
MNRLTISALERLVRVRAWLKGIGHHPDLTRYFGDEGLAAAERDCAPANEDLAAYFRPPEDAAPASLARHVVRPGGASGPRVETFTFDSPRPSGIAVNDRVEVRLWTPRAPRRDGVLVFHHPIFQDAWYPWDWFLRPLYREIRVAQMAAPFHFSRIPPGWYPGEGTINPNPGMLYRAIRQWFADQRAVHRLLGDELELRPLAVIGFSLGAFQALMAASMGYLDGPLVSISSTNRYAYGLTRGTLGRGTVAAMRRAGIDEERLFRLVDSLQLERYVPALHDRPVLYIVGERDRVDPPPSLEWLERALQPTRSVHLRAGHASVTLCRKRVAAEILAFLGGLDLL